VNDGAIYLTQLRRQRGTKRMNEKARKKANAIWVAI
jgi:hypothetical protein